MPSATIESTRRSSGLKVSASVIVASRNRLSDLEKCLQSVRMSMRMGDELIVVDSDSGHPDEMASLANKYGGKCIRAERPGSARARNLGAKSATSSILIFTDDDVVVDRDWIENICSAFSVMMPDIVLGPVFELNAEPPRLLLGYPTYDAQTELVLFSRDDPNWLTRVAWGAIGSGANIAVRSEVFQRLNGFRPGLGKGAAIAGDENYFLLHAIVNGCRVLNCPHARVYHPLQTFDRQLEISESQLAYMAYVASSIPSLRLPILVKSARRLFGRRSSGSLNAHLKRGLFRRLIHSYRLLNRALDQDRLD